MYFKYVVNWFYRLMKVPVPLVLSKDVYGLVTVFDIFIFTVYLGVFIILIKYLITDTLSLNVGGVDVNYSSSSYLPKHLKNVKFKSKEKKESGNNVSDNWFFNNIFIY